MLDGLADLGILHLDLGSLVLIIQVALSGEVVVGSVKLNPLASLLGDGLDGLGVGELLLTEALDVLLLVLGFESLHSLFRECFALLSEESE